MSLLFSTGAIAGSAAKGAPGMVLLTPTSIAHSGTSASIGANGQVTFTAVSELTVNGCFTSDFDNYVVSIRHVNTSSTSGGLNYRLTSGGVQATGSDYTYQFLTATSTSIIAGRSTSTIQTIAPSSSTQRSGNTIYFYGPALAQPTAIRNVSVGGRDNARIDDIANTHSLSNSYDGFYLLVGGSDSMTGALQVYGVRS